MESHIAETAGQDMTKRKPRLPGVRAWAAVHPLAGMSLWADYSKKQVESRKLSEGWKPVRVRIVRESELRKGWKG